MAKSTRSDNPPMKLSSDERDGANNAPAVMLERYLTNSEPSVVDKLVARTADSNSKPSTNELKHMMQKLDALVGTVKQAGTHSSGA